MRVGYLILTHLNPRLLQRIIQTLSSENTDFFVHVDAKFDIAPFMRARAENVVFLRDRISVFWGEFSQVRAILGLIRNALESQRSHDYFVLLSGSDYPLQSKEYIHDFFSANDGV